MTWRRSHGRNPRKAVVISGDQSTIGRKELAPRQLVTRDDVGGTEDVAEQSYVPLSASVGMAYVAAAARARHDASPVQPAEAE